MAYIFHIAKCRW